MPSPWPLIERELGAPAQQLFAEFPDYPMAAASLGQVYRARLANGHWVAVKVQRPELAVHSPPRHGDHPHAGIAGGALSAAQSRLRTRRHHR